MSQYGKPRIFSEAGWNVTYVPWMDGPAFSEMGSQAVIGDLVLIDVTQGERSAPADEVPSELRDRAMKFLGKPYSVWLAAKA